MKLITDVCDTSITKTTKRNITLHWWSEGTSNKYVSKDHSSKHEVGLIYRSCEQENKEVSRTLVSSHGN